MSCRLSKPVDGFIKKGIAKTRQRGKRAFAYMYNGNDIIVSISVGNQKVFKRIDLQFLLLLIMLYTKAVEGCAFK